MRLARKLFLLAAMAITALALTAGTASAQEQSVEVENEATGVHCSVAAANCDHHVVSVTPSVLTQHVFGSESQASSCTDEFVATLGENGNGAINTYTNDHVTNQACTRIKCNGVGEPAAEASWPVTATGETITNPETNDTGHLTVRFCLDTEDNPGGGGTHCNVEIDVSEEANHTYEFRAVDEPCPIAPPFISAELDGHWISEGTPGTGQEDIEIVHQS